MRKKLTIDEFISKANKIHKNKYDYSQSEYIDARTKLKIICPIHGEFLQVPHSHFIGKGCSICGKNKPLNVYIFTSRCNDIHSTKYDYSLVSYKTINSKVEVICKKHGTFSQRAKDHLNGIGCPKCRLSKGELKILNYLNQLKIDYRHQYWFENCRSNIGKKQVLKFDFYIPSKNLLIEFDGIQHFQRSMFSNHKLTKQEFKNTQIRDKIKTEYANKNGITLLRIKYTKLNKIDQILDSVFNA